MAVQLEPLDLEPTTPISSKSSDGLKSPNDKDQGQRSSRSRTMSSSAAAAKKRVERVAHEVAPGLATMVAGQDGLLNKKSKKRLGGGSTGVNRLNTIKASGLHKRYSNSEYQHLVPDESGELHDPEYERIKIVQRRSSETSSHSGDSAEGTSSSEDEAEAENYDHRPSSSYLYRSNPSFTTSRDLTNRHLNGHNKHSSHQSSPRYGGYSHGFGGPSSQPLNSYTNRSRMSNFSTRSSEYSNDSSARSKSVRNYGGSGVTYLAPSITMPPTSVYGSPAAEPYNPYTYVPTTATAASAYSHSLLAPHRSRPNDFRPASHTTHATNGHLSPSYASTSHQHQAHSTTSPSPLSAAYERHPQEEEIAPPIAWNSSFTPSSEHPERHRTRYHTSSQQATDAVNAVGSNIKRSIQSIKLDVSFGLMRLGKKK